MKVHDNFMDESDFQKLAYCFSPETSTTPQMAVTWTLHGIGDREKYPQFVHDVYHQEQFLPSPLVPLLHPLLAKLNAASLFRCKFNATANGKGMDIPEAWHEDSSYNNLKSAVFYINENNGGTEFKEGGLVESKANRVVIFDSSQTHRGVACTDQPFRYVGNFMYYER